MPPSRWGSDSGLSYQAPAPQVPPWLEEVLATSSGSDKRRAPFHSEPGVVVPEGGSGGAP